MKPQKNKLHQNKTFESKENRMLFRKGLQYLAGSLPLLFGAPILVTIGFKALNKGDGFLLLILGCLLTVVTIGLVTQAFRLILKALFNR